MKPLNYTPYHMHSMLSNGVTNIDSITDFHVYIDRAKELGMKAFAFSEHGSLFAWLKKKEYIESNGMKYIHAIEVYLTEDDTEKVRDNYHCVLIATNYDGVKELNKIVSKSFCRTDNHFYYVPRVTFDELMSTSDNILVTTACLGGVLFNGTPTAKEKFLGFLNKNKHRCYLEIQHHNCKEQIEYNKVLYNLSKETGIPLIAGTDTHEIDEKHMQGRAILQKAKGVHFANEDEWDLTFKSVDELISAYQKQGSLPMEVVYEAIENTNNMADRIEPFEVDYSPKYPKLYENSEEVFKEKINQGFKDRGIDKLPNRQEYVDRIRYEYDVYKHNGAIDFMLLEENYKSAMRAKNVRYGYSRGSVSGSIIAYLLHITEIDSIKYNLNFERFMNKERVSLADVDTDWYSEDRKYVKDYLYSKKGLYCCDIVTFNTIALKGSIKDVCRGLARDNIDRLPDDILAEVKEWDKKAKEQCIENPETLYPRELQQKIENHSTHKDIPLKYIDYANNIIIMAETDEELARKHYPEVFYYVDMINGVIVSVGNHPAGCVVSPFPVEEWFGTFTTSNDEYPVSLLNMKEIDSLNFVKLDILGLDNVGLIYKTCDAAGIPYATSDNTPLDDLKVWDSIRDDTTMIFQWESKTATDYLKQLMSAETIKKIKAKNPNVSYTELLAIGNGAIRPAGESYRDKLARGIYQDCGNDILNDFMKPTLGYCIEENQFIQTKDYAKPIKDIEEGDEVYTKSGLSTVEKKTYMGKKPVLTINTQSGSIVCTDNHKILSEYGWVEAGNIKVGDTIAYRVGNESSGKTYQIEKLQLIGYLLGDGILNNNNNVTFCNQDIDVINNFSKCVSTFDNCTTSICNRRSRVNSLDLYYANVKYIKQKKTITPCAEYLQSIGMKYYGGGGVKAKDKRIPEFVFSLNKECLFALLGAYTDTDCSVKNNDRRAIIYKTSSEQLKNDLIHIIRLCGFVAKCCYDGTAKAYAIVVTNVNEYMKCLYDYSYKIRKNWGIEDLCYSSHESSTLIHSDYIKSLLRNNGISLKKLQVEHNTSLYNKKEYIKYKTIQKINEYCRGILPEYLCDEKIRFVKVTSVEESGVKDVYDLSIKDEHNFLCNGFIVHNCVYQEQIIEFLHTFCGYTMGEADVVRRGFAKKTGTEMFIPKIKEGFIKTMAEKYGVKQADSEKIIVNFIKVIEDASSYLFSKNHSIPYTMIGYICGYLRYYYPLEFITSALNIFQDNEEKSIAIVNYAKKRGIKIVPIKFRHSTATYSFDKEKNVIYKGIASIKYMNEAIANEMYELRDNRYDTFIDLLYDLTEKTTIDARQIKILIELNFFEEFGDINYLLAVNDLFGELYNKRQIKKDKVAKLNIDLDIVRACSGKEAEKTFMKVDSVKLLKTVCKKIHVNKRKLNEIIEAQIEYLGYVDIADERYKRMLAIISVDTKYSPRLKCHSLRNGNAIECKIDKRTFNTNKLSKYDVIRVLNQQTKPKVKRNEDGVFEPIPNTSEIWLTKYEKVVNI